MDFINTHPAYLNVVIGSPCSGQGFKFGILTGRLLADLEPLTKPLDEAQTE